MTALRELAERWKVGRSTSPIGPLHAAGINDGFKWAADELLSVLDAEGDGGAVGESAIERLRNALKMHNEHRTTMQSLASSVGDFLREAALAQPAQVAVAVPRCWDAHGNPCCDAPTAEPVAQCEAVNVVRDWAEQNAEANAFVREGIAGHSIRNTCTRCDGRGGTTAHAVPCTQCGGTGELP